MSRPSVGVSGGRENSRRARANTSSVWRPSTAPTHRGLTRSKSTGAFSQPAPLYKAVPVARMAVTRARSGSTGNGPSLPAKDARYTREVPQAPGVERPKTPVSAVGSGGGHRELTSGGTGTSGSTGTTGAGVDSHHTSTFTSIAAKVRPKLASLTNIRRSKSHQLSKSVSASPSTNSPAEMPFIYENAEEPVPPLPAPFARLVPRGPVVRRSISLYDVKGEVRPSRSSSLSKSSTLPPLPAHKFSTTPREPEITPRRRSISRSPADKHKDKGNRQHPLASPIRTVNRHATVYAPAPSAPLHSSSASRPPKHLVKPSLSLTLPNGVSVVHEPLLLSPIPSSIRSTTTPITPPPSRPPPRAHLPESPMSFSFGLDMKPEAWDAPPFPSPAPSAAFSISSYYYASNEATADYRDAINKYIAIGDMESVRSLDIRDSGAWSAPNSHLKAPHPRPARSPAQLLPLDRRSMLPTPEPIGDGKFPPLPRPPVHNKRAPARDSVDEDADEAAQVVRVQRSYSYRSRVTPITPVTPLLLTPKSNMPLPNLPPWRADEIPYVSNQDVSIVAKVPPLKIRSKRTLPRPATGF